MRILFDLTNLHDNFSGMERYALNTSATFIKLHPEHEYVLIFKGEVFDNKVFKVDKPNIKKIVLEPKNKFIFNQITLPKVIKKIEADAYFFLAFPTPWSFKKPNTYSAIHDLCCYDCGETMKFLSRVYFKHSYKKCRAHKNKIITVSNYSKKRIHEILKFKNEDINIIYPGIGDSFKHIVDKSIISKYSIPEKYLLSVSTLEPRKNLSLLLKAYDELVNEGVKLPPLVLAGRKGWKIDNLMDSVSSETKKNIFFTGFVDEKDLPKLYSMADLFIFPTKYEGFGVPPLEAMACEVPVISSNSTCMPEVLGDAAIFFENENLESLKEAIKKSIVIDAKTRQTIIEKGLQRVSMYNWEKESQKLEKLLNGNKN